MEDDANSLTEASPHIVVIHNIPTGTEFGINYNIWYTGHIFCGIHSIPNGFTFIYTSNVDRKDQHSPRNGTFLFLDHKNKNRILRSVWNDTNKEINVPFVEVREDLISGLNLSMLGGYAVDERHQKWSQLTGFITEKTIQRVAPNCGRLSHLTQVDCSAELKNSEKTNLNITEDNSNINSDYKIRFTKVPKNFPENATPAEITKYSMDQSYQLERMLQCYSCVNAEKELLAEIQFAFVSFMIGQVYDAFEHWKTLIRLLCCCDEALYKRPSFFLQYIDLLKIQLEEIPQDFFVDIVAQQNFLVQTLHIFFTTLHESTGLDKRLVSKGRGLEQAVTELFEWSFDYVDDEDKPTIVEGI